MSATARVHSPAPPADALTRSVLAALSRDYPGGFAVRLWTGETTALGPGAPAFTLVLRHPGALRAMFWPADRLAVGESYVFDDFDVGGDMTAFAAWLGHVFDQAARRRADENVRIAWDL